MAVSLHQDTKKTNKKKTVIGCGALLVIVIIGGIAVGKLIGLITETSQPQVSQPQSITEEDYSYKLQLLATHYEKSSSSYFRIYGQVKNTSSESLKNIEAIVECYTDDGTFVKSAFAFIEYNPILPNQTSPFLVVIKDNPLIAKYDVSFKFSFGGTIRTEDKR